MGAVERRERDKRALREEILRAARSLFVEQGYESVSMRKIAGRIDYSPTAIYLHFRDKSDLLRSICDETFAKLVAALERIADQSASRGGNPVELLKKGLHAYVEFGLAHPDHYQLTFLTRHQGPPEEKLDMGMCAFAHLTTAVQACVDGGRFRDNDVATTSQALWAAVHGVTALLIQQTDFPFVAQKKLIRRVIDSMVDGLTIWHP
jgi:AcrR family transcriptional regulator